MSEQVVNAQPASESSATRVRRRRSGHRRENPLVRVWRQYWFEIILLLVVVLGLFLILEQMNIRPMLRQWLRDLAATLPRSAAQFDAALERFSEQVSLSDLLGYALIVLALFAVVWRLRWRLSRTPALTLLRCPRCGGNVHRKHRTTADRLVSLVVPVRRYRCVNHECHWQGLRVTPAKGVPQLVSTKGASVR
jgi:hypothetical protein